MPVSGVPTSSQTSQYWTPRNELKDFSVGAVGSGTGFWACACVVKAKALNSGLRGCP